MGWWSALPLPRDSDLRFRAAPKSMPTICRGLSCGRRGIILSCRARNTSACSWNRGMLLRSLSLPRHSSDGLQNTPSPKQRGRHHARRAERRVTLRRGAPEHDCTTAETDVWDYSHKQGWRNLKPTHYCSTSLFIRGIKSKVHWTVVTFL